MAPGVRPALLALERPPLILDQDGQRVEDFREQEGYDLSARWCKGRDLSLASFFLASDGASFVTGEIICVDGGFLAQAIRVESCYESGGIAGSECNGLEV